MKILLMKDSNPIVVYHQNYRITDHFKEKYIDVIDDKNWNTVLECYTYKKREIDFEDCDTNGLSEAKIVYHIIEKVYDHNSSSAKEFSDESV